jgi:hypothetical protein
MRHNKSRIPPTTPPTIGPVFDLLEEVVRLESVELGSLAGKAESTPL